MTKEEISKIVENQRKYFNTDVTLSVAHRIKYLKKLRSLMMEKENEITEAIKADLGKCAFEGYMCEVGLVVNESSYMIKHLRAYACEKPRLTPLTNFYSYSFEKPSPKGVVLIMSPWNYPFLLSMDPLIDAIAAGNTCVLKPSAYSPNTSEMIAKLIKQVFPENYVTVVTGGREENSELLKQKFDHIFFTGSSEVGKKVLRQAAENLTPVTLELGGKSPCIVDHTANIELAARRIVFGKYLNCGQTCVAPDYILVYKGVHDKLVNAIKKEIVKQYGAFPLENEEYGKIINKKHFDRIRGLIDESKVVLGGKVNEDTLQIEPTVVDNISFEDEIMKDEIFGPILPIITFTSMNEVISKINSMPHPLSLYIFTDNRKVARSVISRCGFGGGCINDVVVHLATSYMPFGGFGESGMGAYHGKEGFKTFSHYKSILDKKTWLDLPMRYQPYKEINGKLLHMFLK